MSKKITNVSYSWEKSSVKLNASEVDDGRKEKWEKILGNKVFEMVKEENPSLLLFTKDKEEIDSDNLFSSKIESMYREYLDNFYGNTLKVEVESDPDIVFYPFFFSLFNFALSYLERENPPYLNGVVKRSYINSLSDKFETISLRTLIFEMNLCKEAGELMGNTPEEEYQYFQKNFLNNTEYIEELFETYPVLLRCLMETIEMVTKNYIEILQHLKADKLEIVEKLSHNKDFQQIKKMSSSLSDSHRGAKGVYNITLDNDVKILYKPHCLITEVNYQLLVNKVMMGSGYPMECYGIVSKDTYGWCEFVDYKSCNNIQELHHYYKRMGIIICVNYILRTNDLHYENIIAHGEFPVIVDLETIMTNVHVRQENSATEKIQEILTDSVLNSGILPHYIWNQPGKIGINISALSGDEGQVCPIQVAKIVEPRTSNMRIEYEYPKSLGKKNLATLDGEFIEPQNFKEDIAEGFCACYDYFTNNQSEVLKCLVLFKDVNVRYLVRDTQQYSLMLRVSYHPSLLQKSEDRELFFYSLFKNVNISDQYRKKITKCEIKDMVMGDIPFFYFKSSGTSLFSSQDKEISDFFYCDSYTRVINKLKEMSTKDCEKQKLYILLTLSKTTMVDRILLENQRNMWEHYCSNLKPPKEEVYLNAARVVGDRIIEGAIYNKDKTDVNWIGISLGNEEAGIWDIEPLGMYLYDGIAGIAVFFKALSNIVPEERYKKMSQILDNVLFKYTDLLVENPKYYDNNSVGAFFGEASILYTYEICYKITRDEKFIKYSQKHYEIIAELLKKDKDYDYLLGSCGALQIVLNLYELTQNRQLLDNAVEFANKLIENAKYEDKGTIYWVSTQATNALAGLSHGQSGFSLMFARMGKITKNQYYINISRKVMNYEDQFYNTKIGNWSDQRIINGVKNEEKGVNPVAWCHGATGILLSRIYMYDCIENNEFRKLVCEDIDNAVQSSIKYGYRNNYCLCHGDFGNIEILREYAIKFQDKKIEDLCNNLIVSMTKEVINKEWHCGLPNEYENPGFMTGISGIGYSLLRRYCPQLPNVLALDINY